MLLLLPEISTRNYRHAVPVPVPVPVPVVVAVVVAIAVTDAVEFSSFFFSDTAADDDG